MKTEKNNIFSYIKTSYFYFKRWMLIVLKVATPLLLPGLAFADVGNDIAKGLDQIIYILSGPIGLGMLTLSIIGSGFMFFRGHWDVMRILQVTIGSALVYLGVNIAEFLRDTY